MKNQHHLNCEAPICADDPENDFKKTRVWFPGEPVCGQSPYQPFQRKQAKINRLVAKGLFKHSETYFTAEMLDNRKAITKGMKGRNPELAQS